MMSLGISPRKLRGYEDEIGSHLTLAQRIAEGQADVGLGTERVTRQMDGLDFVPVQEERYDLILKKELNVVVDWSKVNKTDYLLAMERSPIKDIEIKELLKRSLTDKINDREVYIKGIDNSYLYEGYLAFKTDDL